MLPIWMAYSLTYKQKKMYCVQTSDPFKHFFLIISNGSIDRHITQPFSFIIIVIYLRYVSITSIVFDRLHVFIASSRPYLKHFNGLKLNTCIAKILFQRQRNFIAASFHSVNFFFEHDKNRTLCYKCIKWGLWQCCTLSFSLRK